MTWFISKPISAEESDTPKAEHHPNPVEHPDNEQGPGL